jgi:hypothetical protein
VDEHALEAALRRDPPFDPDSATVIATPTAAGPGTWAGAPGALVAEGRVVIAYRMRSPAPERGHRLVVAESADGVRFQPLVMIGKGDLGALSIERAAIVGVQRGWRLFVSFVSEADRRWRIDAIDAPDLSFLAGLDLSRRRDVLTADQIGGVAVKDPWIRRAGDAWYLFASFAPIPAAADDDLHAAGDALSSGRTGSYTGRAVSSDGVRWTWRGPVLAPDAGRWDSYTARLSTAIRTNDGWIGFYDGSAFEGNYEERCGVAFSQDLIHWRKGAWNGPIVGTARGAGGVRYLEAIEMPDGSLRAYFEYTRADGTHELRTAPLRLPF